MKLHTTLVDHLLRMMEINSGWKEEWKLKAALNNLDVSVYTSTDGQKILVPTIELQKYVQAANNDDQANRQQRIQKLREDAKRANEVT